MKKGNLVVNIVVVLALALGLAGCLGSGEPKPSKEVILDLATKSVLEVVLAANRGKMSIETPYGRQEFNSIQLSNLKFLNEIPAIELVKRKDANGIERSMWVVDVQASVVSMYNEDRGLYKTETAKYKMFVYKDGGGKYFYENGALEHYDSGSFKK